MDDLRNRVTQIVRQVVMETISRYGSEWKGLDFDSTKRRPLVVANWKMNLLSKETRAYAGNLELEPECGVEVVICPPLVLLPILREAFRSRAIGLGAQNLHSESQGAFTGEHSGNMLKDAGAGYTLVGHSERRQMGESDSWIAAKAKAAWKAGLRPIVCVGEKLDEHEQGATFRVLRNQLTLGLAELSGIRPAPDPGELVVAYEPVWAIGTGHHATPQQAQEASGFIRERLSELWSYGFAQGVRILYGGSVTVENAESLAAMVDVDGFLVGGASLDPKKMSRIVSITAKTKGPAIP